MKKTYTGHDFMITRNYREVIYGVFSRYAEPETFTVTIKWTGEKLGTSFKSIEEARAAIRKFCEEHNAQ